MNAVMASSYSFPTPDVRSRIQTVRNEISNAPVKVEPSGASSFCGGEASSACMKIVDERRVRAHSIELGLLERTAHVDSERDRKDVEDSDEEWDAINRGVSEESMLKSDRYVHVDKYVREENDRVGVSTKIRCDALVKLSVSTWRESVTAWFHRVIDC